jgi:hypothetical protein
MTVEVRLVGPPPQVPAELRAELDAWGRTSGRVLAVVDGMTPEAGAAAAR